MQITKEQLINATNVLIEDLEINNPMYKNVIDVAQNPVIRAISATLGRTPTYFADPIEEYVQFDLRKIKEAKAELRCKLN